MSMPTVPDITPVIDISKEKSVDLLIASAALQELALAHVVNAEAEKIQFVLGTLKESCHESKEAPTLDELIEINKSVDEMLKKVIEKEILLDFILEDAIKLMKMKEEEKGDE